MASKFQNKINRVLYRPKKKNPYVEFVTKKLEEAEKALGQTVGGMFKKPVPKPKKKD